MALVIKLDRLEMEKDSKHSDVDCTYSIITDQSGARLLQIDTYGSATRKIPNKKSQSIRFSPEALVQLKEILSEI